MNDCKLKRIIIVASGLALTLHIVKPMWPVSLRGAERRSNPGAIVSIRVPNPGLLRRLYENLPTQETAGHFVATTTLSTSSLRFYPERPWARREPGLALANILSPNGKPAFPFSDKIGPTKPKEPL